MAKMLQWKDVRRDEWSYSFQEKRNTYLIYELTKVPDFTEHRFSYLGKDEDERGKEIAKKQLQMLRQFHGFGSDWAISLRFVKDEGITLYLVFRYAGDASLNENQTANAVARIQNALLNREYSFRQVKGQSGISAVDASWAGEAAEITKNEEQYSGDTYPNGSKQIFYVPYTWTATENTMEQICSALMNHRGKASVEITISPSEYLINERNWMNESISRLKDAMNGETLRSPANNKILWQGKKLPILKVPLDNCEKMTKQYEVSRIFLSAIRVFSDSNVETLAQALLTNSVKNDGIIQIFRKGFGKFNYIASCYQNVDLSADSHTRFWMMNADTAPMRAQRLNRLVSLEEIANFFRFPIPNKPGFPGFGLDTGLGDFSHKKKARSIIRLGNYLDDNSGNTSAATFDSQQLAKHGLIVGVPGSGKTTAMFNILDQLWNVPDEQKIPFIVLEPAKTEYRALMTLPEFQKDMLVFSLGDESVSPFRFNPMEILPGIPLELHISRLQSCFIGAFDLFDPLPVFLEQAIRRTYEEKGWYSDSIGGEEGLETPTLSDLCRNAEYIVSHSGFDSKMASNFKTSLLERLNSLRRGSKGRMLDTLHSIPMEDLMERPVILELDSLNGDEKTLLMMFLLTYVFEYCKIRRKSGSPLKHMLLVEEAHNLIGAQGGGSSNRADPRAQTIELFVNMLAEMRALGQGILIADQLPTAIAPQAVKQTNVKVLMRVTAKDDREEIGNTMDLNEEQLHQVVKFKTGHAYVYHEGEDHVRMLRMLNFKDDHDVSEPPSNAELRAMMSEYEQEHRDLYVPFAECNQCCGQCNKRVRNQAESFVRQLLLEAKSDPYEKAFPALDRDKYREKISLCQVCMVLSTREAKRLMKRYHNLGEEFGRCVYIHIMNQAQDKMSSCCAKKQKKCNCTIKNKIEFLEKFDQNAKGVK